jgi:hypothetical protein
MKRLLKTTALAFALTAIGFAEDTNVKTTKTNRDTPTDATGKGTPVSPNPGEGTKDAPGVKTTKTTQDTPTAPAKEGTAPVKERRKKKNAPAADPAPATGGTDVKNTKTTGNPPKEGDPNAKPVNPNPGEGNKGADALKNTKTTK